MALTHGSRLFVITLVIATACVALFWGSQRHAQAEETTLAGRILCYINSVAGPPIPRFNVGECPLSQPPPPPAPTPACADGADNDGDGLIDWSPLGGDPGCSTPLDTDEANAPVSPPPPPPPPPTVENTLLLCSDGIDNDSDSLTDLADSDCSSFNTDDDDDSEPPPPPPPPPEVVTPPPSGGGSGGGGGGGGSIGIIAAAAVATALQNISSSTIPAFQGACDRYLTAFIRSGFKNDESQVRRLQTTLRDFEGANITVNGVYDAATLAAVHTFQTKYASEILAPWGARASTGYVYFTTRKKINEIYCRNTRRFDLSVQELATIERTKAHAQSAAPVMQAQLLLAPFVGAAKPSPTPSLKEETIEKSGAAQTAAVQTAVEAVAGKKSLWRRVLDIFRIR